MFIATERGREESVLKSTDKWEILSDADGMLKVCRVSSAISPCYSHFVTVTLSDVATFVEPSAGGGQKRERQISDPDTRREWNTVDVMA